MQFRIRDFTLADLEAVKRIHEATGLDYRFPDLPSPLFLVKRVLECDGIIRACVGGYLQIEAYLWLDNSAWTDPAEKLEAIRALNEDAGHEAWLKGVDCACLWLPPEMKNFGKRLEQLGFKKDRDGWQTYSKQLS